MDTQLHEEDDKEGYEKEKNGYKKYIEGKQRELGAELGEFLRSPELTPMQRNLFEDLNVGEFDIGDQEKRLRDGRQDQKLQEGLSGLPEMSFDGHKIENLDQKVMGKDAVVD